MSQDLQQEIKKKIQKELDAYLADSSTQKPLALLMKETSEWLKSQEK